MMDPTSVTADERTQVRASRRHWKWRRRISLGTTGWLTLVWPLLYADFTLVNLLAGLLVALAVQIILPMPPTGLCRRIRPTALLWLVGKFVWDLAVSTVQVSRTILRGEDTLNALVRVQLVSDSDLFITMVSGMTSLIPGSVVVQAYRHQSVLYLHVLDIEAAGGVNAVRRVVRQQEDRVLRALASRAQLEAAGLTPPVWWAPWRGKEAK